MAPINVAKSPKDGYDPVRDGELHIEIWIYERFTMHKEYPRFRAKVSLGEHAPEHALDWGTHYNHFLDQHQLSIYCDDIEVDLSGMVLVQSKLRIDTLEGWQPGGPRTSDQINPARPIIPHDYIMDDMVWVPPSPEKLESIGQSTDINSRSVDTAAGLDMIASNITAIAPRTARADDTIAPHEHFSDLLNELELCFDPLKDEYPPAMPSTITIKDDKGVTWFYEIQLRENGPSVINQVPALSHVPWEPLVLGFSQGLLMGCPSSPATIS